MIKITRSSSIAMILAAAVALAACGKKEEVPAPVVAPAPAPAPVVSEPAPAPVAEVASFDGFGGTTDDALYATVGLSLAQGPITYNAAFSRRDITSTGVDNLFSLGLDYEMKNGATLTAGYGFANEGGSDSHMLGLAVVIPIGG